MTVGEETALSDAIRRKLEMIRCGLFLADKLRLKMFPGRCSSLAALAAMEHGDSADHDGAGCASRRTMHEWD